MNSALNLGEPALVFQSRSGPPSQPWLGPDISECLREIHSAGTRDVVIAPIGFISDHLEILYDLDVQARQHAAAHGLELSRTQSLNADPKLIQALKAAVLEALA